MRILVTIACLLLGLAVALPSGAAVDAKKPCKPKTATKCKAAAKPKPKPCKPKTAKKCKAAAKPKPKVPAQPPAPQPPAPQPPATPPTAAAEYTFGAGVAQPLADEVRAATDRAVAYFTKIGAVPPSIRMHGYADSESTAQAYAAALNVPVGTAQAVWASSIAVSTPAGIFINLGATYWRETTPALRAKVIAHELFHLKQEALAGSRWAFGPPETIPGGGPRWLIEGAAELIGFLAVADSGMLAFEQARAEQIATSKYADAVPLGTWANLIGINEHPKAAYNVFFVAAEYLTRDRGRQSLLEFWRAIGAGQSWEAAFATAFGRTPEAFYSDFERYRQTL